MSGGRGALRGEIAARLWNCSRGCGIGVAVGRGMRTGMRTMAAMAAAGLAIHATAGCIPGGCGGADPEQVRTFAVTAAGTVTVESSADGIAATPTGMWVLRDGAVAIDEYDRLGGAHL